MRVDILLIYWQYLHDRIILQGGKILVLETSLTLLFLYGSVCTKLRKSTLMYICVKVSILRLDFETSPIVWYFSVFFSVFHVIFSLHCDTEQTFKNTHVFSKTATMIWYQQALVSIEHIITKRLLCFGYFSVPHILRMSWEMLVD